MACRNRRGSPVRCVEGRKEGGGEGEAEQEEEEVEVEEEEEEKEEEEREGRRKRMGGVEERLKRRD